MCASCYKKWVTDGKSLLPTNSQGLSVCYFELWCFVIFNLDTKYLTLVIISRDLYVSKKRKIRPNTLRLGAQSFTLLNTLRDPTQLR